MIFSGSKFCPHCGERVVRMVEADAAGKQCPRCRVALQQIALDKLQWDECPRCSGLWTGIDTLSAICENADEQSAVLQYTETAPEPEAENVPIRYVPCPVCRKLMNRVNFAAISGVIVDICKPHGTWFDAEELRRIVEFIRTGGLAKSRRRAIQQLEARERSMRDVPAALNRRVELPAECRGYAPHLVNFLASAGGALIRRMLR
jgi:Zn-finger nucleic acid-binding protein